MRDHTELRAFELADEVAVLLYRVTARFPKEELYGLTSQMRRAAISIPSNPSEASNTRWGGESKRWTSRRAMGVSSIQRIVC